MPCSPDTFKSDVKDEQHPAAAMTKKSGDLVSHDILECYLCRNATGCVQHKTARMSSSSNIDDSMRLSLKETESDESALNMGNGEIEIPQSVTNLSAGEHNTFFPS